MLNQALSVQSLSTRMESKTKVYLNRCDDEDIEACR